MRVKFTIAVCALLMLGLAVTHVNAQGFNVSKSETYVAEHGRNQMMGAIRLEYTESSGNIDNGSTITVSYSNLRITTDTINSAAAATSSGAVLLCSGSFTTNGNVGAAGPCRTAVTATAANDADSGVGTVTIKLGTARTDESFVILRGVRADVSALSAGDMIVASINSTAAPAGFVPIGQDRTESLGGVVSTVKGGLTVKIEQASRLLCNLEDIVTTDATGAESRTIPGGVPSITVSEGFPRAWEDSALSGITATMITIKMNNLPKGVELRWPNVVLFDDPADGEPSEWSRLTLTEASRQTAGIPFNNDPSAVVDAPPNMGAGIELVANTTDMIAATNGESVTYEYLTTADAGRATLTETVTKNVTTEAESFKIVFEANVEEAEDVGTGGVSDIWAWLAPAGKDDDRDSVLSYNMMAVTDPDVDEGDIINFGECVTYLMFPYLTCGDSANWTTAIAIANTTMDDGVFGITGGAAAQSGKIMLHAFPRSVMGEDGMRTMDDPMTMELTENLAAGDTYSTTCSQVMPGFAGYAIARTSFRHAHGVAFVLGSFDGGATIDLAHGYLALVIPDPEFDNRGRGAQSGETLGQ